jgi:hypothetical protein
MPESVIIGFYTKAQVGIESLAADEHIALAVRGDFGIQGGREGGFALGLYLVRAAEREAWARDLRVADGNFVVGGREHLFFALSQVERPGIEGRAHIAGYESEHEVSFAVLCAKIKAEAP